MVDLSVSESRHCTSINKVSSCFNALCKTSWRRVERTFKILQLLNGGTWEAHSLEDQPPCIEGGAVLAQTVAQWLNCGINQAVVTLPRLSLQAQDKVVKLGVVRCTIN